MGSRQSQEFHKSLRQANCTAVLILYRLTSFLNLGFVRVQKWCLLCLWFINCTVARLLIYMSTASEENIVLEHEEEVKADGKDSKTKLSGVTKDGFPVIYIVHCT